MNKSMLTGVVAGIAVATAGGVAGYQFFGQPRADQQGSAEIVQESLVEPQTVVARAEPAAQPQTAASAQSRPAARPASTTAAPKTAAVAPAEECWDEEVTVEADKKDPNAIAGTAIGAVVGGAIGKDVGDRNLTTAAGAAAGAFIGRKIQKKVQDNHAADRTTTHVERRCAPAGTPH
ncbi:MAG TPA: glycine zipper 2TM domain-containing protein [Gammaproteobacteria bacterium]|nr:glycine zipper 2TM domain-containing protein [Gammaproteobacteria bacterium]